jgi:DNA sulfur modification protein DndD
VRIKSIELRNFRAYQGVTRIDFPEPKGKDNITLISGKNGFGKTSFLTSILWGFYGKLISKVEDKYKKEIRNSGGYENYLKGLFNKYQKKEKLMLVEIVLTDILIPSVPCKEVKIIRTFNYSKSKEELHLFIDGKQNELTKQIGYETFINDFILPREIAKFFFFDSEKIVSLAEAKTADELKDLSKAYSEVLGIKKYEDLKSGLQSLISTINRRGLNSIDKKVLNQLIDEKRLIEEEISFFEDSEARLNKELELFEISSESLQEKLIREGSSISLERFKEIKENQEELRLKIEKLKPLKAELIELLPFAIAHNQFEKLVQQVKLELGSESLSPSQLEMILDLMAKSLPADLSREHLESWQANFKSHILDRNKSSKFLLDLSPENLRFILNIDQQLRTSYKERLDLIISEEKDLKFKFNKNLKTIKSYESKGNNTLTTQYRLEKQEIDGKIKDTTKKLGEILARKEITSQKLNELNRRLSVLEKNHQLEESDLKKKELSLRALNKIETIISRIKIEKKYSLEKSILLSLNKLMHKGDFVSKVDILLKEDYMDILLIDKSGEVIDKESLSKGEQQLYATSILRAMVIESGIDFPIFVDSPLQKFDSEHAENIITKFYPTISSQVVLLPLLEKELTFKEFKLMEQNVNAVYKILNEDYISNIEKVEKEKLFD